MPQVVPTALRTLQVFETFARERRPLTNSELARYLDLADSSCSDLLHTLREAGYLLRTPKSRCFYPTGRLVAVAQAVAATDPVQILASEILEQLTRESNESSLCGCADGQQIKIVACQESSRPLRYVLQPGTVIDMHSTSLGKAVLGAMPEKERNILIDNLSLVQTTSRTIIDKDILRAEIEASRKQRWYLAQDEGGEGVTAIAISGIFDGTSIGFALVGPSQRMTENHDRYVGILLKTLTELATQP